MRPEGHTMTTLSVLVVARGDREDVVALPGRRRPPPDEDHGVGARPERLGDAVRRLASSISGLIAVGGLLAAGGLLVDAIFRAVWPRCVRQRMRRGGRLVEEHFGYAASQAPEFRFWGAVLALIGPMLFVFTCLLGVRTS
jgi:hypothetical protein